MPIISYASCSFFSEYITTPTLSTVCVKREGMDDVSQIPSSSIAFPNNDISPIDVNKIRPGNVNGPLSVKETSPEKPVTITISLPVEGVQVGEIKVSPDDLLPESEISQKNIESFTVSYKTPGGDTLQPLTGKVRKCLVNYYYLRLDFLRNVLLFKIYVQRNTLC